MKQIETKLAQLGNRKDKVTGAVVTPIYLSAAYAHPGLGESTGFDYTRTKNPTRTILEILSILTSCISGLVGVSIYIAVVFSVTLFSKSFSSVK